MTNQTDDFIAMPDPRTLVLGSAKWAYHADGWSVGKWVETPDGKRMTLEFCSPDDAKAAYDAVKLAITTEAKRGSPRL